jgi:hypothetical protein
VRYPVNVGLDWIGLLITIVASGVLGGVVVNRRFSNWSLQYRLLAVLIPTGWALLALSWTAHVLFAPNHWWNQARLAPLFGLRYGYSLYYPSDAGPVLDVVYGPIAYLAYFPSLLAHLPIPALLIGSTAASLYYFLPVAWIFMSGQFRRREGRALGLFLLIIFAFWTISSPPLQYSCFNIHADAPALGFGAIASALLMRTNESRQPVCLRVLAALFTVLAIFSKQSTIFLVPVLLCFIWITDGRRASLEFAIGIAILSALAFGFFSTLYSPRVLYFNLYSYPSRLLFFDDSGHMQLSNETGMLHSAKVLYRAGLNLWEYSRWIIPPLAVCYLIELQANHLLKCKPREWLRKNRWAVFHFVALGGLPMAVLFGAKVGGDVNNFSLHLYFGLIGLLLFFGHLVLKRDSFSRLMVAVCVSLAAVVILTPIRSSMHVTNILKALRGIEAEQVYQYAKEHPGEVYFSFFPLPILLAEGRMYHFEYSIFAREIGGAPITQSHFLRYIPAHPKYVQRESGSSPISKYMPRFSCETMQPGISGLTFYADCSIP